MHFQKLEIKFATHKSAWNRFFHAPSNSECLKPWETTRSTLNFQSWCFLNHPIEHEFACSLSKANALSLSEAQSWRSLTRHLCTIMCQVLYPGLSHLYFESYVECNRSFWKALSHEVKWTKALERLSWWPSSKCIEVKVKPKSGLGAGPGRSLERAGWIRVRSDTGLAGQGSSYGCGRTRRAMQSWDGV